MTNWRVELEPNGKWHCYHQPFTYATAEKSAFRLELGKHRVMSWIIEAITRSQALSIAKADYKKRNNLKKNEVNINSALPIIDVTASV